MSTQFPYPGLRPFREDEADIFFGREEQTDELLKKLGENKFLAIVGASGCGKSSLARAGMISALKTGFMAPAGARWRIAVMRPGSHPIKRLAEALNAESILNQGQVLGKCGVPFLDSTLRRGPLGLIESLRQTPIPPRTNLLILVDQFEEIFRFRTDDNMDEQDAFIELLLETSRQTEFPVFIVITMRSDYIGDCAIFPGLPETLNASQFLTPRLNRDQREKAIIGPARVFGGRVEPSLVNRLLNETGSDPNQLPVLQHVLMRMWACTKPQTDSIKSNSYLEEVPPENMGHVLTISDYESVGGLTEALSRHADEAFNELKDEQKRIAEILFRNLCERGSQHRDGRRPTRIGTIADQAGVPYKQVIEIVELFRNSKYGFLLPSLPEILYESTVIDISHESLIRIWKRLNDWVDKEIKSAGIYERLVQTALLRKKEQAALYGTPDLEIAQDWKKREHPTEAWAERYGGNFQTAMDFLHESEKERDLIKAKKEQKRRQEIQQARQLAEAEKKSAEADRRRVEAQEKMNRLLRRLVISLVIILILTGAFIYWYLDFNVIEHVTYYNTFTKRFGFPVGIGKLSNEQVARRACSFKLIKKGSRKDHHVFLVEAVNGRGELTTSHNIGTYFEQSDDYKPKECQWEFIFDEKGNIVYEMAKDKKGGIVWGLSYVPMLKTGENFRDAYFLNPIRQYQKKQNGFKETNGSQNSPSNLVVNAPDKEGKSKTNNGPRNVAATPGSADTSRSERMSFAYSDKSIRIEYTKNGDEGVLHYRDRNGNPLEGPDNSFGRKQEFYKNGLAKSITSLDINNKPMNDEAGNAALELKYDEMGNITEAIAEDTSGALINLKDGWAIVKFKYDKNGNRIWEGYFDDKNNPTDYKSYYFSSWKAEYDSGYQVMQEYFDVNGKPVRFDKYNNYAIWKDEYDDNGNRIKESYFDADGKPVSYSDIYYYSSWKADYNNGNLVRLTYLGTDGKPVQYYKYYNYASWKAEYDDKGNKIKESYFDADGKPVSYGDNYSYAGWKAIYEKGRQVKLEYFDTGGNPVKYDKYSDYAGWTAEYDDEGNKIQQSYFDAEGKPVSYSDDYTYAGWKAKFVKGRQVRQEYFDAGGKPVRYSKYNNYAGWTAEYDDDGNQVRQSYFGTDSKPVSYGDKYAYAGWKAEYYRDHQIMLEYFGVDGNPVKYKDQNYAGWKAEYDDKGNRISVKYFDTNGKPVNYKGQNYASWKGEYDNNHNKIMEAYFDANNKPVNYKNQSYASWKAVYDNNHHIIKESYYDVNGNPVNYKGQNYASWKARYDKYGNKIMSALFDVKGNPVKFENGSYSMWKAEYDRDGNQIMSAVFGVNGRPVNFKNENYSIWKAEYNKDGKQTLSAIFDVNGKPVKFKNQNYSSWKAKYDNNGNSSTISYFDVNGKPVNFKGQNFASWKAEYDENGKKTLEAYFDINGKPVNYKGESFASWKAKYDTNGNKILEAYFDVNGKPVNYTGDNYASWKAEYDAKGNKIMEACFDVNGKPVNYKGENYTSWKATYNSKGKLIKATYYDVNGKPVVIY